MRETEFNKTRAVILLSFPFVAIWSASECAEIWIADDYSIQTFLTILIYCGVLQCSPLDLTLQNPTFIITMMSKKSCRIKYKKNLDCWRSSFLFLLGLLPILGYRGGCVGALASALCFFTNNWLIIIRSLFKKKHCAGKCHDITGLQLTASSVLFLVIRRIQSLRSNL
jgi:hypothetical protein